MNKFFLSTILIVTSLSLSAQNIITYCGPSGLCDPNGLVVDKEGNIFTTTLLCNTIVKIDTARILSVIAGNGTAGYIGDDGPATGAMLNQPCGITLDRQQNIIFADVVNSRIRKIEAGTGIITTIAGVSTSGFTGDGGPATNAKLFNPSWLCFDTMGNLFFTDAGNKRVRKIDTFGTISTIAGNGVFGVTTGDGGPATVASIVPGGICIDSKNNIYVTQNSGPACSIRKISASGMITTISGDSSQYIYNGDQIPASAAHISPMGICIDREDNLFFTDNDRVRMIDRFGIIHTVAGNGVGSHGGDGGPATAAEMHNLSGLSFDHCGNLFVNEVGGPPYIRKISFNPACWPAKVPQVISNALAIYPNPAENEININNVSTSGKYVIVNIRGIIEQQGHLHLGDNSIPIKSLPPGIYLFELKNEVGEKIITKITKL